MSKRLFLYAAWCVLLIGAAILMSFFAWSPFSDGSRSSGSGGGYYGGYGPNHK